MTDPLRFDPPAVAADVPERDRDARVEELLLSGLDHYFAGQHDQAINVWTRVLFLDRGHARARAYIERARTAMSERQREGEELIHSGATAFQHGDVETARRLITSGVERGAATDEAFALLERLQRVEAAGVQQESRAGRKASVPTHGLVRRRRWRERRAMLVWLAVGTVVGLGAAAVAIALLWTRSGPWLTIRTGAEPVIVAAGRDERVPVPAAAGIWMARARALFEKGRLREALSALDEIPHGDPLRPVADELRGTVQRRLLESARGSEPGRAARPASPTPSPVTRR
jgi:hypothetical protein